MPQRAPQRLRRVVVSNKRKFITDEQATQLWARELRSSSHNHLPKNKSPGAINNVSQKRRPVTTGCIDRSAARGHPHVSTRIQSPLKSRSSCPYRRSDCCKSAPSPKTKPSNLKRCSSKQICPVVDAYKSIVRQMKTKPPWNCWINDYPKLSNSEAKERKELLESKHKPYVANTYQKWLSDVRNKETSPPKAIIDARRRCLALKFKRSENPHDKGEHRKDSPWNCSAMDPWRVYTKKMSCSQQGYIPRPSSVACNDNKRIWHNPTRSSKMIGVINDRGTMSDCIVDDYDNENEELQSDTNLTDEDDERFHEELIRDMRSSSESVVVMSECCGEGPVGNGSYSRRKGSLPECAQRNEIQSDEDIYEEFSLQMPRINDCYSTDFCAELSDMNSQTSTDECDRYNNQSRLKFSIDDEKASNAENVSSYDCRSRNIGRHYGGRHLNNLPGRTEQLFSVNGSYVKPTNKPNNKHLEALLNGRRNEHCESDSLNGLESHNSNFLLNNTQKTGFSSEPRVQRHRLESLPQVSSSSKISIQSDAKIKKKTNSVSYRAAPLDVVESEPAELSSAFIHRHVVGIPVATNTQRSRRNTISSLPLSTGNFRRDVSWGSICEPPKSPAFGRGTTKKHFEGSRSFKCQNCENFDLVSNKCDSEAVHPTARSFDSSDKPQFSALERISDSLTRWDSMWSEIWSPKSDRNFKRDAEDYTPSDNELRLQSGRIQTVASCESPNSSRPLESLFHLLNETKRQIAELFPYDNRLL